MNPAALYDEHAPTLYALALRITSDPAVAADVVEDVLVSVIRGRALVDPAAGLGCWLIRKTRDYALARREDRTPRPDVDSEGPAPSSLVRRLFFDGTPIAALAETTGVPASEIRRRLVEGMASLRQEFGRTATP